MIPLWWEILKNAKLSGKAKGKSFDASKIKINIDKNDCKERLRKLIWFNTTEPAPNKWFQSVGKAPSAGSYAINTPEFNKLPEKVACNILERMKSLDLNNIEDIEFERNESIKGEDVRYKNMLVGEGYRLFLEVDEDYAMIRYYISDGVGETAWIMFPFSDIKKWMAAL